MGFAKLKESEDRSTAEVHERDVYFLSPSRRVVVIELRVEAVASINRRNSIGPLIADLFAAVYRSSSTFSPFSFFFYSVPFNSSGELFLFSLPLRFQ